VVITVVENPVINRIVLEGNKRLKDDKILPEIKLAPRQIFTRSKVRADVARIIELYKRQGRFAATVEPQMVQLDQNRVDVVFEINEGPKSKVRAINIIGNEAVLRRRAARRDGDQGRQPDQDPQLDHQLRPRPAGLRPAAAARVLPVAGLCDFRIVSAVAELTPDKRDFIITFVSRKASATSSATSRRKPAARLRQHAMTRRCRCRPATGTTPSWSRTRSTS
jgi:outer membrane protein insertion porin family